MTFPTIHLNGTDGEALFEQTANAIGAVTNALNTLAQAAPNGRDYYVQNPDGYPAARAEHEARLQKLREVRDELCLVAENIRDQVDARGR